jgi:polyisoprenoid-binding protein YceI
LVCATLVAAAPSVVCAQAVAPPAAATTVYNPGDAFLPGCRVYAFVGKTGFGHEHGVVGQLQQGRLDLAAAKDAGQLVFDMQSFTADTDVARQYVGLSGATPAATRQEVRANMLGSAVLDAAHYPTASLVVRTLTKLPQPSTKGLPQYQLGGDFTLHGVTRPIQVVAEAEQQKGWLHLRGGFTMLQSQFGITPFTKAFGAVGVADELKVYGDLWFARERQEVVAAAAAQ